MNEQEKKLAGGMVRIVLFVLFASVALALSILTPVGEYFNKENISALVMNLGYWGPIVLVLINMVSPLFFLPRWPVAWAAGLLYGLFWGTILATVASTLGAIIHYALARTLLAPSARRVLENFNLERGKIPDNRIFYVFFFLRAFPLSNYVATNLLAGAMKVRPSLYVAATFLGMIPSTIMYASWGKVMKDRSSSFSLVALLSVLFILAGCIVAQKTFVLLLKGRQRTHASLSELRRASRGQGGRRRLAAMARQAVLVDMKNGGGRVERMGARFLTGIYVCLAAFVALNLLYSAWCAFTWGKFTLFDYGVYTNMIWNSGHGAPFKVLVDNTYLSTHLSFTLALLGPFFRVYDHPFMLSFLQWLMVLCGGGFLFAAARKAKVPGIMTASLLFFWIAYRFTQGVVLSEFHGVSMYFLLVPWLYYACSYNKRTAWIPFLLTLGVREEAFILILPMLLYFAIRDRWKAGYIMFVLALFYGLLAIFVLYPAINGITIFDRRGSVLNSEMTDGAMARRMFALTWTLLPIMVMLGRKILPALIFPSAAFVTVMVSGYPTQQAMGSHYGANVMVCLGLGLLEVMSLHARGGGTSRGARAGFIIRSSLLAGVVLCLHYRNGFTLLGGDYGEIYGRPHMRGRVALQAAMHLPKEGVLVTDNRLVGYCANRADILTWSRMKPGRDHYDTVFLEARQLSHINDKELWYGLQRCEFGVVYFDGEYVILTRGHDISANRSVMSQLKYGTILLVLTPKHGGQDKKTKGGNWVRYWCGEGYRTPITLSYGGARPLQPGKYRAVFKYRAEYPESLSRKDWGWFSVHVLNDQGKPLASEEIMNTAAPEGDYLLQTLDFEVRYPADIEVRVTGGDAELWLDRAIFVKNEN